MTSSVVCMQILFVLLLLLPISSSASGRSISSSKVKYLPGFAGPLPFHLETGYIGVDESNDVQLFYYFIESERNPQEDPIMLWLSGGPGCSAISGLFYEIGPLRFNIVEYNGSLPTFILNPYSWTKVSSIIFLDSPVGAGFSYSRSQYGWKTSDTKSAKRVYDFLRKWLNNHSEFINNPVYVGGDSYAGMVIPIIVQEIANGIEAQKKPLINLKGYVLGNPVTDMNIALNSRIPFAHRTLLISDELYESTKRSCEGEYVTVDAKNVECIKNLQAVSECTKGLWLENILERNCIFVEFNQRSLVENMETSLLESELPEFGCKTYNYLLSSYWANEDSVRDALHIRKGTIGTWIRCKRTGLPYTKDVPSAVKYHLDVSTRGYRSLIYSGDHDMMIPHISTQAWIKSLNFSIIDDWRPWFVNSQVAGYTRTYSNHMTFATVKGAGHIAPESFPEECFVMFGRWLSESSL